MVAELSLQSRGSDCVQHFLDRLMRAQRREGELEAAYVEGHATAEQLVELERLRVEIEDTLGALDDMGYFNPS